MSTRMRPARWRGLLSIAAVLTALSVNAASPPIKSYRLELKKLEQIEHGKATVVKGDAGTQPHRFVVDGVNMNMPIVVLARPLRPTDSVDVRLTKYGWDQVLRQATAKGEPVALKFRTEGEFQISVTAAKPTPYRLFVWVGDEAKPDMRPVFVKASEYKESTSSGAGGGASPVMWVIAIALVAIAGLLGVLVLRKKSS